jgi:hypothetical protein
MYLRVGPYTPYFGFGYRGIGGVPIMWPPMSNPLVNPTSSPKPISIIIQVGIVTNHIEPLDEDKDYSKRKHNPKMPQTIPIEKSYHDRKGRPSLIGDVGRLLTGGWTIPTSNNGGGPFNRGGNEPLGGGGSGLPRCGDNSPL